MSRRPLAIFATIAAFGLVVWMPVDRWRDEQQRLSALKSEEAVLATDLADRQRDYLGAIGPGETEQLARGRLGMVRPGERAYVVPAEPEPIERPEVIEPDEPATAEPLWQRAATAIFRALSARI